MTLPTNVVLDHDAKQYLKKSLFWSKVVGIAGFIICMVILISMLSRKKKESVESPNTLKELRLLNENVRSAKIDQETELKKFSDSSKIETAKTRSELLNIHSDLNSIKQQRDENISSIRSYQSADIISAFANLERQYNNPK